jgi:hypothetical protein
VRPPKASYDDLMHRIYHGVGNETGVQACSISHVSDVVSRTLEKLKLRVVMGDFQSGISSIKTQQEKSGKLCPDFVIWAGQKRHIRIVGLRCPILTVSGSLGSLVESLEKGRRTRMPCFN